MLPPLLPPGGFKMGGSAAVLKEERTPSTPGARVYAKHVYGSAYGCNESKLSDENFLVNTLVEAARVGNMKVLDARAWKIGLGVSAVAVILESHISVHTWPEYRFATIDVYTCGRHADPVKSFYYIAEKLEASWTEIGEIDRSLV